MAVKIYVADSLVEEMAGAVYSVVSDYEHDGWWMGNGTY